MAKTENNFDGDDISVAEEKKVDKVPKTYLMLDTYGSNIEKNLKKNIQPLIRHIAKYREKNISILETPYPYSYPIWTPKDTQIYFDTCGIDYSDFRKSVNDIELPDYYTMKKEYIENKSIHLLELLILREMMKTNMSKKYFDILLYYIGYNYYWRAYTVSFKFNPDKRIVEYTINNLSYRYYIKKLGSVHKLIYQSISTIVEKYKDRIMRASDYELIWVSDRILTKFKGYVIAFAKPIYENAANKNLIFKADMIDDNGAEIENSSQINSVIAAANKYTTIFFSNTASETWLSYIAKNNGVAVNDLRNTINLILNDTNANFADVNKYFQAMFYIFMITEGQSANNINTRKFIIEMNKVYKKGNSNDKNVEIIKLYLNKWLTAGSATYKSSNRAETLNKFRRAIFEYFTYTIASGK